MNCPTTNPATKSVSKLLAAVTGIGMLALSATSALGFTNFLANPGFETGLQAPWGDTYNASHSVDSTNGWVYNSGNTIHEPTHSGKWAMKSWGTFWGSGFWQTHTIYQDIPAAANSMWSGDVWVYTATPDNIKGQNYAQLRVIFYDSATNQLAAGYSATVDATSPTDTWIHLAATNSVDGSTNLTAPFSTAFVRFALPLSQDTVQSGGSVYFDDANLVKTAAADPEIAAPPHDATVIYGQAATFSVVASGNTALTYEWWKVGSPDVRLTDGGRISGASTAAVTIGNVTKADETSYYVKVTDTAGSLQSLTAWLTVVDPGILTNPTGLGKVEGQSASFTVVAAGSGTLTYAWYNGTTPLANDSRISGANTATLTIANLTTADSGDYSVTVTGAGGAQVTSSTASLYVKTAAQASNLIRNGGFESAMANWTAWNGYAAVTAPPGVGETNYDGNYICRVDGTGNGTWNGINQSAAAVPGYVYKADAWFLVSTGNPIVGASTAWLEVNFYHLGGMLSSVKSPIVSSNWTMGVWTNLSVPYAVAPANADEVRCQINYHAGDGGGAVYVDDVSFWIKIPVTVTASVSEPNLVLSFPTQIGVSYQVLYKDDMSDAVWKELQTVVGGLTGKATIPTTKTTQRRFYLVNTL